LLTIEQHPENPNERIQQTMLQSQKFISMGEEEPLATASTNVRRAEKV